MTEQREEEMRIIKVAKLRKTTLLKDKRDKDKAEKKKLKKLPKAFEGNDTKFLSEGVQHEISPFRMRGPPGAGVGSSSIRYTLSSVQYATYILSFVVIDTYLFCIYKVY